MRSPPERVNDLYEAFWDRILRAFGRTVIDPEMTDWPKYFDELRYVTRKVLAENRIVDLSESEKAYLVRRLVENIDQLENEWRLILTEQAAYSAAS